MIHAPKGRVHEAGSAVDVADEQFIHAGSADTPTWRAPSLIMVIGDPHEAAALGGQAPDAAGTLRSRRATDDLRELRHFAEPHARLTEVAELRQHIGTMVAAHGPGDG